MPPPYRWSQNELTRLVVYLSRDHDHFSMEQKQHKAKILLESVLTQCEQCHDSRVTWKNANGDVEIRFQITL